MSSHCCRVFANVFMLLVLVLWLPMTHSAQIEYWLSRTMYKKLEIGFDSVSDVDTFKEYFDGTLSSVFYPDQGVNTDYLTSGATRSRP